MNAPEQQPALPGVERLRRSRDFEAVMRHGKRARGPVINLTARANHLPYSRVGYAVSRRVGSAVTRNRVKRRLRAIVQELPITPGFDIVAVPQPPSAQASYQELTREAARSIAKLSLLEASFTENGAQSK